MRKDYLKTTPQSVNYKGVNYPVKLVENTITNDIDYVGTKSLEKALGNDVDNWGEEERRIDEMFAYYFSEEEFNASDERITEFLIEIGASIAETEL